MDRIGVNHDEMWDEDEGFYYDLLRLPNGDAERLKVRSLVGLLPLCASTVFEPGLVQRFPRLKELVDVFRKRHPEVLNHIAPLDHTFRGHNGRALLSVVTKAKLQRILKYMLDENEFFGPYGIRSLSRYHLEHPYILHINGLQYGVHYLPAESNTGMFGGNSNWRGPVWMPVNLLLVRSLLHLYQFYGKAFTVECPTGSGKQMTLYEVAMELGRRLERIFLRDDKGHRPVFGGAKKFHDDPHWRDYILFYEYFHGENGAGLGASHQTGWTGVIARIIDGLGRLDADRALDFSKEELTDRMLHDQVAGDKRKSS